MRVTQYVRDIRDVLPRDIRLAMTVVEIARKFYDIPNPNKGHLSQVSRAVHTLYSDRQITAEWPDYAGAAWSYWRRGDA